MPHWAERGFIIGGWACAGILALVAVFGSYVRHGGDGTPSPRAVAPVVRTPSSSVADAVASPQPTVARPTRTPREVTPIATPQASATRCDELRGSADWSAADREWFLSSCLGVGTGTVSTRPPSQVTTDGQDGYEPPPPAAAAAPTATAAAAGDGTAAAAFAERWLRGSAPVAYNVEPGGCSAQPSGAQWTATCRATLAGCASLTACGRTVVLCLSADLTSVTSYQRC